MIAPIIKPPGISKQQAQYVLKEIREFVAEEHQDLVCPPPPAATLSSSASVSVPSTPAVSKKKTEKGFAFLSRLIWYSFFLALKIILGIHSEHHADECY